MAEPNKKKSVWKGNPVRKVEKFIEVRNRETGRLYQVAVLACGHGAEAAASKMNRRNATQEGVVCYVCPPVEPKKPKLVAVAEKQPESQSQPELVLRALTEQGKALNALMRKLTELNERVEQVEDSATRPSSGSIEEPHASDNDVGANKQG